MKDGKGQISLHVTGMQWLKRKVVNFKQRHRQSHNNIKLVSPVCVRRNNELAGARYWMCNQVWCVQCA